MASTRNLTAASLAPWRDKRSKSETHRWRKGTKIARIELKTRQYDVARDCVDEEFNSIPSLVESPFGRCCSLSHKMWRTAQLAEVLIDALEMWNLTVAAIIKERVEKLVRDLCQPKT
jgi:hypothetical protein